MRTYVFAQLILATEESAEGSESSGLDLLLPAPEEMIAGIIAFGIVFFFVWKWAVPALNKTLEARQGEIASEYESAEKAKVEAESLLKDYRSQISGANEEAEQIVADARDAGDALRDDIVARAETEADQIRVRADGEIEAERARIAGDIRRQVADLSIDVAERVVGSSLDAEAQRDLVDRYIDDLGGVQ
jgi:F-type H+-transporting ATPase subunit b